MAFWYNYSVKPGFNNSGTVVNFETYFKIPLRGERVPDGEVTEKASDGWEVTDGWRLLELTQEGTLFSELSAYVVAVFGSWTGPDTAEVTLRCRLPDNSFDYFNAYAYRPSEKKGDYQHLSQALVEKLRLRFLVIDEAS